MDRSIPQQITASISANWIINRRMDLAWFIGGALAAYALFFVYAGLGWDMVGIWFLWVVLLDGPHFFGTISRTFFDRQELRQRRRLLLGSLVWYVVGPGALVVAWGLYEGGVASYQLPWKIYLVFFGIWAYWHIVRQHYGFMRLYQKKNDDTHPLDARIDSALLYGGLVLPFLVFIIRHPEVRGEIGLTEALPLVPSLPEGGPLAALFDVPYLAGLAWEHWVVAVSAAVIGALVVAFVVRQVALVRQGEKINGPKILFLLAVVPLHVYVCFSPAILTASLLAFSAFITIFHDIQYHAIVWFHHRNRYHRPGVDAKRYGLAPKISKNLLTYFGIAIFFALIFRLLGCSFAVHPGCTPFLITSDIHLFGTLRGDAVLKALMLGFPLQHYFIDQFIWKTSASKELRKDLRLEE